MAHLADLALVDLALVDLALVDLALPAPRRSIATPTAFLMIRATCGPLPASKPMALRQGDSRTSRHSRCRFGAVAPPNGRPAT
jgi:hypothetical protein